jgi:magnesium transporter
VHLLKTIDEQIVHVGVGAIESGVWINLVSPTDVEVKQISDITNIDIDYIKSALDEEERPRIEQEKDLTFIVIDIPIIEVEENINVYSTIPLGIILVKENIITVCLKDNPVLKDLMNKRIKNFSTAAPMKMVLQILYRTATLYLQYLKHIDKTSSRIEAELHKSIKNAELIQLLKLEKSLTYFSTSLKSNEMVLEKLEKCGFKTEMELLEDVIIENKQAIEMANIYSSILSGTMDAFASLVSNNLNLVMKHLTSVTILIAIPTMVFSFFGMNIPMPFGLGTNNYASLIITGVAIVVSIVSIWGLNKRRLL